jgi:hypothetical protein
MAPRAWRSSLAAAAALILAFGFAHAENAISALEPVTIHVNAAVTLGPSPEGGTTLHEEATFTGAGGLCPSGTAVGGFTIIEPTVVRTRKTFDCADESGVLTIEVSEPRSGGGKSFAGPWQTVSGGGTGQYAGAQGSGTFTKTVHSYDPATGTGTYSVEYVGNLELDQQAPSIRNVRLQAVHPKRRSRTYVLKIKFTSADNLAGNTLSYGVVVRAGTKKLTSSTGATDGRVVLSLRTRVPVGVRKLRVQIRVADPAKNRATATAILKIPR